MKTRSSLVSNSSSSSFILIGIPIQINMITKEIMDRGDVFVKGRHMGEGVDFIDVKDEGMLKFIQEHEVLFGPAYCDCRTFFDKESVLLQNKYENGEVVVACDKDNYCSENVSDLIEHYLDADELRKESMKLLKQKYGVEEDED